MLVQLFEGGRRFAVIAQIAISVVLDHGYTRHARRFEKRLPGRQGQSGAGGILKIRCHHQEARPFALQYALQMRRVHTVGAHRDADQLRTHAGQQILQTGVDRIFHRDGVARPQQDAPDQVERLLAAVGDEEVVARARERLAAGLFHEVPPQGFVAAGRTELKDRSQLLARQHGLATGAEIVQREERSGGPGHDETGDLVA